MPLSARMAAAPSSVAGSTQAGPPAVVYSAIWSRPPLFLIRVRTAPRTAARSSFKIAVLLSMTTR